MKLKYRSNRINKRLILGGAVFPLFTLIIMLSSEWLANFRLLRMMGCYVPVPMLTLMLLLAQLFLSLTFFADLAKGRSGCKITAYNVKVLSLSGAFLLVIWFCMEFCVISPFVSALCLISSLCASAVATAIYAGRGKVIFLATLAATLLIAVLFFMNIKVLFI